MSPLLYSARHIRHRGHGSVRFALYGIALGVLLALSI